MATGKDFFDLVKSIGESKSKQEEDRIVAEELIFLKKKIAEPGVNKKKMKELVIRSMYVEMLGQDASFSYIRAVELCASTNIHQKRSGYLAASLFLSPEHEFRFMLVNQIQRDMNSTNQLETCAALSAVCRIVTVDMIPAVLGEIIKLLKHEMDSVRKRAICALHRLYQMDKGCLQDHVEKIRRIICDKGRLLPIKSIFNKELMPHAFFRALCNGSISGSTV
jgi:AP-4 complex subunit epsilon-1